MERGYRFLFARDALVATAILVGFYGLAVGTRSAPVQIPEYLIIVGFNVLETVFGPASKYRALFAFYLIGLGLLSEAIASGVRRVRRGADVPSWCFGIAGALAVIGVFSLLFAVASSSELLSEHPSTLPV